MSVLVGKNAPDFTATAVMPDGSFDENFNLKSYIKDKVGILFFYPLDFTFVCPSEIIAFDKRMEDFKARGAAVIGVSIDSHFTHLAWRNTRLDHGGIGPIHFPLVSDITKSIARDYDVLVKDDIAYRGTFMIDKKGIVRHQLINDLPLGRNVDEALRMVDALNFTETHGEVCPAGWRQGQAGMKPTSEGVSEYLAEFAGAL